MQMIEICDEELRMSELFFKYATREDILTLEKVCKKVKERRLKFAEQKQAFDSLNDI